jgi:hypothetical protein
MESTREKVLELLEEYARRPKPVGPVALEREYLEGVERWENLPENAEGSEKGWVLRADRSWRESIARARLVG